MVATCMKEFIIGGPNDNMPDCMDVGYLSRWSESCAVCIRQSVRETAKNGAFTEKNIALYHHVWKVYVVAAILFGCRFNVPAHSVSCDLSNHSGAWQCQWHAIIVIVSEDWNLDRQLWMEMRGS